MKHLTRRSGVRRANKLIARTLVDLDQANAADLVGAQQAALDLLARSIRMGHCQLAWRRLDAVLRLGLDLDEETQRYFAHLPKPGCGSIRPMQGVS